MSADLYTRPLRASVRELLQEDNIDIAEALYSDSDYPTALSNLAEVRVAAQKVVFEADALMCAVLVKAIEEDD